MTRRLVPCFLALLTASSLLAQAGPSSLHLEPLTGEVTVGAGQTTNHELVTPKVAVLGQKEFLVSWDVSYINYNGSQLIDWGSAIVGRKVSLAGQPAGAELRLEPFEQKSYQTFHHLAADGAGRFSVLWQEMDKPKALLLRRFAPDGSRLETTKLKPYPGDFGFPLIVPSALAMDRSGRLAAVWPEITVRPIFETRLWMQLFDASGAPHGKSFEIPRRQGKVEPSLAMGGGKIILAYRQKGAFIQFFDFEGRPIGREVAVVGGEGSQIHPSVAANTAGRFVVVWSNRQGIQARLFDAAGKKVGPVIQVSTETRFADDYPHAVMDPQGNFVVVWQGSTGSQQPRDVRARLFNRDGVPQGSDLVVASELELELFSDEISSVAMTDTGRLLIAWQDLSVEDFISRVRTRLYAIREGAEPR
jgi:hypothetical protein